MSRSNRTATKKSATVPKYGFTNPEYLSSKQRYDVGTIIASADRDAEVGMQIANSDECQSMSVIDNALSRLLSASERYISLLSSTSEATENYNRLNEISTKALLAINKLYRKKEMCKLRDSNPEMMRFQSLSASLMPSGSFSTGSASPFTVSGKTSYPEDASIYQSMLNSKVVRACGFRKFKDIVGRDSIKTWFNDNFVNRYKFPQFVKNLQMTQGVMIYGPPGTGKTSIAEAFAGELEALKSGLFVVSANDINAMYAKSKNTIRIMFEVVRAATKGDSKKEGDVPVVVVIDEFEKLSQDSGVMSEFVKQYDALLDAKVSGIIFVASVCDSTLVPINVVSKLFSKKEFFGLPTLEDIREMIMKFVEKITLTRVNFRVDVKRPRSFITEVSTYDKDWDDVDFMAWNLHAGHYSHKEVESVLKYINVLSEARTAKFFSESPSSAGTKVEYQKWILDRHRMIVDEVDNYGVCVRQKEVSKYSFIPLYFTVFNENEEDEIKMRTEIAADFTIGNTLIGYPVPTTNGRYEVVPKTDLTKNIRVVTTERTLNYVKTSAGTKAVWTYRIVRRQEQEDVAKGRFIPTVAYHPTAEEDITDRMSMLIGGSQITYDDFENATKNIKSLPIRNAAKYIETIENFGDVDANLEELSRLQEIADESGVDPEKEATSALAEALMQLLKKTTKSTSAPNLVDL